MAPHALYDTGRVAKATTTNTYPFTTTTTLALYVRTFDLYLRLRLDDSLRLVSFGGGWIYGGLLGEFKENKEAHTDTYTRVDRMSRPEYT